jgi:hypothetical protein
VAVAVVHSVKAVVVVLVALEPRLEPLAVVLPLNLS